MATTHAPTCAHAPCNCSVAAPGEFCGEYCRSVAESGVIESACACGHLACAQLRKVQRETAPKASGHKSRHH
ncbi:hypothetical protein EYV96_04365 [Dyella terrae]|uniref:Uncharacterized protein n=2 Tax=Dyella TaxID=231454 RepID=A0A4R0Z3L9_9GAMM|nr:hypothetical protein EYV96_04365 [Dyella terrae]TCI12960.1 hypothetical protein EZM97_06500 [Dyella soli]